MSVKNTCHRLTIDRMEDDVCRLRLMCREIKKVKNKDEQPEPEDLFSLMPPSEGLKFQRYTMMTVNNNDNREDGPIGMATWNASQSHMCGDARRRSRTSKDTPKKFYIDDDPCSLFFVALHRVQ